MSYAELEIREFLKYDILQIIMQLYNAVKINTETMSSFSFRGTKKQYDVPLARSVQDKLTNKSI